MLYAIDCDFKDTMGRKREAGLYKLNKANAYLAFLQIPMASDINDLFCVDREEFNQKFYQYTNW